MEQMYLIEIFIDKVTIYAKDEDEDPENKHLFVRVKIGPSVNFVLKEQQEKKKDEQKKEGDKKKEEKKEKKKLEKDEEDGKYKWSKPIRAGKSYLVPLYPEVMKGLLSNYNIELDVWNDDSDESEGEIFVGTATVPWDSRFTNMIEETKTPCKTMKPLTKKDKAVLSAECCCKKCGEVDYIVRVTAVGKAIVTDFKQLEENPESFTFKTHQYPSTYEGKLLGDDDDIFDGSIYVPPPEKEKVVEVCTDLNTCSVPCKDLESCKTAGEKPVCLKKEYPCEFLNKSELVKQPPPPPPKKIKMGDIVGPCGNPNCTLAHKIRQYIRNLDSYKKVAVDVKGTKGKATRKICGSCICKDDKWHAEKYSEKDNPRKKKENTVQCQGCGGHVKKGDTCYDRYKRLHPDEHVKQIHYVLSVPMIPRFHDYKKGQKMREMFNSSSNSTTSTVTPLPKSTATELSDESYYSSMKENGLGFSQKDGKVTQGCCCNRKRSITERDENIAQIDKINHIL